MFSQSIESFRLPSGLRVIVEAMPGVQSAAMSLLVPAGSARDPHGRNGIAAVTAHMVQRGAGGLSAREHSAAMDNLGLQRDISVGAAHLAFSAATTSDRLCDAIREIARMVCQPHLEADEFAPSCEIVRQGLLSLEDEPQQLLGKALRRYSLPSPWNQHSDGELEDLSRISVDDVRSHVAEYFRPDESILGIAGNFTLDEVRTAVESAWGGWQSRPLPPIESHPTPPAVHQIDHESAQTHIGLAWDTVPYRDNCYYEAWAVVGLLSGGMSSRLFTEVRERRGLCYSISASISTLQDEGRVFAYAGTTPERAQETLDVTIDQILQVHEGITEGELQRCKARAKSSLIMQQESTMARAGAVARDIYHLGRVVPLSEIHDRINALTVPAVRDFAIEHEPRQMVLVTLGPAALDASSVPGAATAIT